MTVGDRAVGWQKGQTRDTERYKRQDGMGGEEGADNQAKTDT